MKRFPPLSLPHFAFPEMKGGIISGTVTSHFTSLEMLSHVLGV